MWAIISHGLYSFYPAVYIVEQLVLQTICVINKKILQFLGITSVVYNQQRVIMGRVQYWALKIHGFHLKQNFDNFIAQFLSYTEPKISSPD